jgi:hypothetical protein
MCFRISLICMRFDLWLCNLGYGYFRAYPVIVRTFALEFYGMRMRSFKKKRIYWKPSTFKNITICWHHQHRWRLSVYSFHVEMMNNQLQTKLKDLTANNPNFLFLIFSLRRNVKANLFIISLQVSWSFFLQSSQISSSYNKWWIYKIRN